ncbi:MAG: SgcJ/EcaC family oxidoreductase [Pseudomonadota bacterium]
MAFQDEVEALAQAYLAAYAAEDAAGCAGGFAEDARLDTPFGPPALGRAAIAEAHLEWFEEPECDKRMDVVECGCDGALGWALLRWSAEVDGPQGGAVRAGGATLATLRRGEDGWRFHRMALIPDP